MSDFMNRQSFKQMDSLVNKYANQGLTIEMEFVRWGLILRGIWDLSLCSYDIRHFNREYYWRLLEEMPEGINLEYLIDEFKKEFEEKIEVSDDER